MIQAIMAGLSIAGKLGDKLIEDKDKRAEYAFRNQEMAFKTIEILMNAKTYPWIDGLVKLAYASESIIKGLFRPVGAFLMAGFAAYCDMKGIELSPAVQAMLYGSPVAWGYSRHQDKKKQKPEEW